MGPSDLERLRYAAPAHDPALPGWLRRRVSWPAWSVACDHCGRMIARVEGRLVHLESDDSDRQLSQVPDTVIP